MVFSSSLFRSTRAALGLGALGLIALTGCGKSNASVASASAGSTGCPAEQLSVFNKSSRSWYAACGERVFMCQESRKGAECAPQDPKGLSPALMERVRALNAVPKPQRDALASADITKGTWDEYAKLVGAVGMLKPEQVKSVPDAAALYTDFSPAFDSALVSCLGVEGVVKVSVARGGSLSVSPSKGCVVDLRSAADLAPLRARSGSDFYLAAGVRGVTPAPHPVDPNVPVKPAGPPPESELSKSVRSWLDGVAKDITTCTNTETAVVSVHVDAQGLPTTSLREELAGTPAEGCVRAALPAESFAAGPETVVHLVRRPEPTPEELEAAAKAAEKDKKKKGSKSSGGSSNAAPASSAKSPAPAPAPGSSGSTPFTP